VEVFLHELSDLVLCGLKPFKTWALHELKMAFMMLIAAVLAYKTAQYLC
jgi:hypothetical protein